MLQADLGEHGGHGVGADGPFRHDPDYEYLDPGFSEGVAGVIGKFVNDTLGKFRSFDCDCGVIANTDLDNLSESFKNA
jgi:hypothetical protein